MALSPKKAAQVKRIKDLQESFHIEILSHYYMRKEVKDISSFVGGTRFVLERALNSSARALVICAVNFISERVRDLRPEIPVLVPRADALCPMSIEADLKLLENLRQREPKLQIVAGLKTGKTVLQSCDKILEVDEFPLERYYDESTILFPSLTNPNGRVKESLKDIAPKCQVHAQIEASEIMDAKKQKPQALVLANILCDQSVIDLSDFSGDSDELFQYVNNSQREEFIVVSEAGLVETLSDSFPGKKFYELQTEMFCPNMKLTNIKDILSALEAYSALGPFGIGLENTGESKIYDLFR
jgi:quinolinate synthase